MFVRALPERSERFDVRIVMCVRSDQGGALCDGGSVYADVGTAPLGSKG